MKPFRSMAVVALAATALAVAPARADEVYLREGGTLVGRVIDDGGPEIEVVQEFGAVRLAREEVLFVRPGATPREEFRERLAAADADDPEALAALGAWAEAQGLADKAREVRAMERDLRIERRVREIEEGWAPQARDFVELARWAAAQGAERLTRRVLLERALEVGGEGREVAAAELDAMAAEEAAEREARIERERLAKEREALEKERKRLERERRRLEWERILAEERRAEEAREREAYEYTIPAMYTGGGPASGWKTWRYGPTRSPWYYYLCGSCGNQAILGGHSCCPRTGIRIQLGGGR